MSCIFKCGEYDVPSFPCGNIADGLNIETRNLISKDALDRSALHRVLSDVINGDSQQEKSSTLTVRASTDMAYWGASCSNPRDTAAIAANLLHRANICVKQHFPQVPLSRGQAVRSEVGR